MQKTPITWLCRLQLTQLTKDLPPVYLAPFLHSQASSFSTSTQKKYPRDNNPQRGRSALRRTGLREPLEVSKEPLPEPVLDPKKRSKIEVNQDHGLHGFFNKDRKPLNTPEEDYAHGIPNRPKYERLDVY